MKYKAKVNANVVMTVWMNENENGDTEMGDIDEILDICDFEILDKLD